MALPATGHADTSTPKPPGKPDDGKKPDSGKKPDAPKKDPEHLGYEVVDMMPPPYIERDQKGKLELASTPPGASIAIDGGDLDQKNAAQGLSDAPSARTP